MNELGEGDVNEEAARCKLLLLPQRDFQEDRVGERHPRFVLEFVEESVELVGDSVLHEGRGVWVLSIVVQLESHLSLGSVVHGELERGRDLKAREVGDEVELLLLQIGKDVEIEAGREGLGLNQLLVDFIPLFLHFFSAVLVFLFLTQ